MGIGRIKLSDGTILNLKICIIDVKEVGYSPFEGINFDVKTIGGVAVEYITEEVKRLVADKPLMPFEPPREGWESLEIVEQQPAIAEVEVQVSRGVFVVKVVAEAVWRPGTCSIGILIMNQYTGFHGFTKHPGEQRSEREDKFHIVQHLLDRGKR